MSLMVDLAASTVSRPLVGAATVSGDGWLIYPFSADGLVEYVGGGLVVFGDDVGVVFVAASGHGCVDACMVGRLVNEEEGGVSGAALGGM